MKKEEYHRRVLTLIVTVLFGLIIAYFGTQNTDVVTLNFLNYSIPGVPVYIVVVGSLLVGLFLSWVISLVNTISTGLTILGNESELKGTKKENTEYLKQIHQLQLENARLTALTNVPIDDKSL